MVVIRRVASQPKPDDSNPANEYSLISIHFEIPTSKPTTKPVEARPFEFDEDGTGRKYATLCPHCAQGNYLVKGESITKEGDNYFAGCTECGTGFEGETPEFEDPFQNPIKDGKISEQTLDQDLDSTPVDDTKTVAEKIAEKASPLASDDTEDEEARDTDEGEECEDEGDEELESTLDDLDAESQQYLDMLDQREDEV